MSRSCWKIEATSGYITPGDFQSSCLAEIIPFSLFLNSDISGEKSILPVTHKDYQKSQENLHLQWSCLNNNGICQKEIKVMFNFSCMKVVLHFSKTIYSCNFLWQSTQFNFEVTKRGNSVLWEKWCWFCHRFYCKAMPLSLFQNLYYKKEGNLIRLH